MSELSNRGKNSRFSQLMSPEKKVQVVRNFFKLYAKGISYKDAAKLSNVDHKTIRSWIKNFKLEAEYAVALRNRERFLEANPDMPVDTMLDTETKEVMLGINAKNRSTVMGIQDLYKETDLPITVCCKRLGMGVTQYYRVINNPNNADLLKVWEGLKELRNYIAKEIVKDSKADLLLATVEKIREKVSGWEEETQVNQRNVEELLDISGKKIGEKVKTHQVRKVHKHQPTAQDLRLSLDLMKIGKDSEVLPETVVVFDEGTDFSELDEAFQDAFFELPEYGEDSQEEEK
ncbi:MAG: hypothetical protein AAFO96_03795 [Bacteroidota bacterium]